MQKRTDPRKYTNQHERQTSFFRVLVSCRFVLVRESCFSFGPSVACFDLVYED